jgi:TolB protein
LILINEYFKSALIQYNIIVHHIKGNHVRNIVLIVLSLSVFSGTLLAVDATLKIEKDVEQRARIALVDSSPVSNQKVFDIFQSDLKVSGHFLPDEKRYTGDLSSKFILPSLKNQEYVLKYSMVQNDNSKLFIRLFKVSEGIQVFKKSYALSGVKKMPFLIHKAVSDINNMLKYPDISWINRYVVYATYTSPRNSEIHLADYTFNYRKLIVRGGLNLFPKWADKNQRSIYYTSYKETIPTLYKMNIYSGEKSKILSSEGMVVCSDVSQDDSKILVTMAPYGQADIYEFSLNTKEKKQITRFKGIDVNGRYIDNEQSVVFVSNRLGHANIFRISLNNSTVSQVVYHGRSNNACDTNQNKIVYASRESNNAFAHNTFNIYLTSVDNDMTRPLTTTGSNLFPRFSSDGSVVLFLKQSDHHTSVGYINLATFKSLLFPYDGNKIQSIDW